MNLWGQAADVLFGDQAGAVVDGQFTAPPAAPIDCRILFARRDEAVELAFPVEVRAPGWEAHVKQAQVAVRPRVDLDYLTAVGINYRVRDVAEDVERTEWRLDVIEM